MQENKNSETIQETASEKTEAVRSVLPELTPEELEKLANFTGTIEVPVGAPEPETAVETAVETQETTATPPKAITEDEEVAKLMGDFEDFESLLWGGNLGDMPVVNYGDEYVVKEGVALAEGIEFSSQEQIIEAIRTVEDPELMLNVYDLGLIYRIETLENGDVDIDMTVTAPSCPVAGVMPKQVAEAVSKLDGVGVATVTLVWEPAWTMDKMTDEAKFALDLF